MPVQSSELRFYKPALWNETESNGGYLSATAIPTAVKNNIWPDVPEAERQAGSVKYRKQFFKVVSSANTAFTNVRIYVENPTPGSDRVVIFPGTQTDTQGDLAGSGRVYGAGFLDATVTDGATTLAVNVESAADTIFRNGDLVRISDKASVVDPNGNVEFMRLASTGGVTWNGTKATLVFAPEQSLRVGYVAATTRVASVIEAGDVKATWDAWSGSSTAGTYDGHGPTTPPTTIVPILNWTGSIEQTWTLAFTGSSQFACFGDRIGSVGNGSIDSSFAPNNPDFGVPYFTLPATGWGGVWASGDTVTFKTHPAAVAFWAKRIVPAGASSLSANRVFIAVTGESA